MPSSLTELPRFFFRMIDYGLDPEIKAKSEESNHLLERTSLFHSCAWSSPVTPEQKTVLERGTYAQIPAQFVPRPLWPEKPVGTSAPTRLAIYYGLQRAEDTVRTTIGFGLVTRGRTPTSDSSVSRFSALWSEEVFKLVSVWASEKSPFFRSVVCSMVILMAWSFQNRVHAQSVAQLIHIGLSHRARNSFLGFGISQ